MAKRMTLSVSDKMHEDIKKYHLHGVRGRDNLSKLFQEAITRKIKEIKESELTFEHELSAMIAG